MPCRAFSTIVGHGPEREDGTASVLRARTKDAVKKVPGGRGQKLAAWLGG